MLTKPVGTRRVVEKVSDLPSGLSAAPGEEYIVREDEGIYGLDGKRQWVKVGSYAKHSTVKAEDLTAHLESTGNPHKTSLADVLKAGGEVELEAEVLLKNKGVRVLPKPGTPGFAVGEATPRANAAIALNGGRKGTKAPLVGVYETEKGETVFLLDGDGNLESRGEVSFAGGWKGDLPVSGVVKTKAIVSAEKLEVAGERVVFIVGKKGKKSVLVLEEAGAVIEGALGVSGTLILGGTVSGDVSPTNADKNRLGDGEKRWQGVFARTLNLEALEDVDEPMIAGRAKAKQKANLAEFGLEEPGDLYALTAEGRLGLGTKKPRRRFDTKDAIFGRTDHFQVVDLGEAGVQLGFNFLGEEEPENKDLVSWRIIPGGSKRDYFEVLRREKGGAWGSMLRLDPKGASIGSDLAVKGDVRAEALLAKALSDPEEKNVFLLAPGGVSYTSIKHQFAARLLKGAKNAGFELDVADEESSDEADIFRLLLNKEMKFRVAKDGSPQPATDGKVDLGSQKNRWLNAWLAGELVIGKRMVVADGIVGTTSGDLELDPKSGVLGLPPVAKFRGVSSELRVDPTTNKLVVAGEPGEQGDTGEISFDVSKERIGIEFSGAGGALRNIRSVTGKTSEQSVLDFEQHRVKDKVYVGLNVDAVGRGAKGSTLARIAQDGKVLLGVTDQGIELGGPLNVNGVAFEKIEGVVDLADDRTGPSVPEGAFILAVTAEPLEDIEGCQFFMLGVNGHEDLFSSASAKFAKGQITRGVNHHRSNPISSGSPIVVSAQNSATGKLKITAHYLNPGA